MKYLITLAFLACYCHALQSQNLIAVEHNGQASFFTTIFYTTTVQCSLNVQIRVAAQDH